MTRTSDVFFFFTLVNNEGVLKATVKCSEMIKNIFKLHQLDLVWPCLTVLFMFLLSDLVRISRSRLILCCLAIQAAR